jgi:hypothetical protein
LASPGKRRQSKLKVFKPNEPGSSFHSSLLPKLIKTYTGSKAVKIVTFGVSPYEVIVSADQVAHDVVKNKKPLPGRDRITVRSKFNLLNISSCVLLAWVHLTWLINNVFKNVKILSSSGEHMFVLLKGVDFHILTGAPSPGRPFTPSRTELLIASANSPTDNIPFLLFFQKDHGASQLIAFSI